MTTFVDLDNVLVNFDKGFRAISSNRSFDNVPSKELQKIIDSKQDLFRDLELMLDALVLWNFLIRNNYNPEILTALPKRVNMPTAAIDKEEWVREYLGTDIPFHIGPFAVDKQNWCKTPDDILIDDSVRNIEQWIAKGGIGILHTDSKTTISKLLSLWKI